MANSPFVPFSTHVTRQIQTNRATSHENHTTMAEEAPLWEASKENAAPLERGRNVHALERSLQMETTQERQEKEKQLQHYEKLVSSQQNDPLIHWLSYIKFHQEAYPSDTHAQFLLMERCTRALFERKEYANDVRFIRVCVTYADKTSSPGDVFKHLHQSKVGSKVALFWMAWAWVAESKGDFEFADKVFVKGIAKNATPVDKLKQRHKQFQRRFAKHMLKEQEEGEMNDEQESKRGRLAGLSEDRVRRNDRSTQPEPVVRRRPNPPSVATFTDRSVASRSAATSNNNNGAASFPIFVDDSEHDAGYNLDQSYAHAPRELEREVDRKKENSGAAERWNDRGGLGSGSFPVYSEEAAAAPASTGLSFDVYMDEECAVKHEREKQKMRTEAERARQDRDERTLRQHEEGMVSRRCSAFSKFVERATLN
jgi:hypothetical protein